MKKMLMVLGLTVATASLSWGADGVAKIMELRDGTAENQKISGTVTVSDMGEGLHVVAQLKNVPPGKHGFHIHEYGSCEDHGNAAGSHFNPEGHVHGNAVKKGISEAHVGDMGNIEADSKGDASLDVMIKGVQLASGKYAVAGRAIVLHEKADDFGQPVGNAGSRIGCGTLMLSK